MSISKMTYKNDEPMEFKTRGRVQFALKKGEIFLLDEKQEVVFVMNEGVIKNFSIETEAMEKLIKSAKKSVAKAPQVNVSLNEDALITALANEIEKFQKQLKNIPKDEDLIVARNVLDKMYEDQEEEGKQEKILKDVRILLHNLLESNEPLTPTKACAPHAKKMVDLVKKYHNSWADEFSVFVLLDLVDYLSLGSAIQRGELKEIQERSRGDTAWRDCIDSGTWNWIQNSYDPDVFQKMQQEIRAARSHEEVEKLTTVANLKKETKRSRKVL
jgi:hypothetical protein